MAVKLRTWVKGGEARSAYQVTVSDYTGKRRRSQFSTRKEAAEFERRALAQAQARKGETPASVERQELTVAEAGANWLNACLVGRDGAMPVENSSYRRYERHLRLHIAPRLGHRKLAQLDAPAIVRFRDEDLLPNLSRPMVRKVITSLHAIFATAVTQGLAASNPVKGVKIVIASRQKKQIVVPTREEIVRLVEAIGRMARAKDPTRRASWLKYRPMMLVLILTGMRISEVLGLAWRQVNLKDGTIAVDQRADEDLRIGEVKSAAAVRAIAIPRELVKELTAWRKLCKPNPAGLVFANGKGRVDAYGNIRKRAFDPLMREAGLIDPMEIRPENLGRHAWKPKPKFTIHALRHYRASELIAAGLNLKELMRELGHSDSKLTIETYGHLFPEDDSARRKAAAEISRKIFATNLPHGRSSG